MSDQDNTVVLGTSYGAGTNYSISGASIDTITIDPSSWLNTSITTSVPYTWTTNSTGTGTNVFIDGDGLTMKEGADIKIGGKSLTDAIEKIEDRLGILNPNPELEDRWEQLKELRRQYIELEKDLLEKEKIMKILKEK